MFSLFEICYTYLADDQLIQLNKYMLPDIDISECCKYAIRYKQFLYRPIVDLSIQQDHLRCFKILNHNKSYSIPDLINVAIVANSFRIFSHLIQIHPHYAVCNITLRRCCLYRRRKMLEYCTKMSSNKFIHIDRQCLMIMVIRSMDPQFLNFVLSNLEPGILSHLRNSTEYIIMCIQFGSVELLKVLHAHGFVWPIDITDVLINSPYVCKLLPVVIEANLDLNWLMLFERLIKYHLLYMDGLLSYAPTQILQNFDLFIYALCRYGNPSVLNKLTTSSIIPFDMYELMVSLAARNGTYWICQFIYYDKRIAIDTNVVHTAIENGEYFFLRSIIKWREYVFNAQEVEWTLATRPLNTKIVSMVLTNFTMSDTEATNIITNFLRRNDPAVIYIMHVFNEYNINTELTINVIDSGNIVLLRHTLPVCSLSSLINAMKYSIKQKKIFISFLIMHEFLKRKL